MKLHEQFPVKPVAPERLKALAERAREAARQPVVAPASRPPRVSWWLPAGAAAMAAAMLVLAIIFSKPAPEKVSPQTNVGEETGPKQSPEPPKPVPPTATQIEALVKQLADEAPAVREAAEAALLKAGEPALGFVESAEYSDDPDLRMRATRLAARLRLVPFLRKLDALGYEHANAEYDVESEPMHAMPLRGMWSSHVKRLGNGEKSAWIGKSTSGGVPEDMVEVEDGEYHWLETRPNGQLPFVVKWKQKPHELSAFDALNSPFFNPMGVQKFYTLEGVRTERVDGEDLLVLRARPNVEALAQIPAAFELCFYFSGDLKLKMTVLLEKDGKINNRAKFSGLKTGVKFDSNDFKYTPPEGASVADRTND